MSAEHTCPAGYCEACGQPLPRLPWTTAEQLMWEAGHNAVIGWPLPSGDYPVYALGKVLEMSADEVGRYQQMCAAEAAMERLRALGPPEPGAGTLAAA